MLFEQAARLHVQGRDAEAEAPKCGPILEILSDDQVPSVLARLLLIAECWQPGLGARLARQALGLQKQPDEMVAVVGAARWKKCRLGRGLRRTVYTKVLR